MASASLSDLVDRIGCRTLFSTHYHSIAESFQRNARVGARMMQFLMEPDARDADRPQLVFLYKMVPGVTPSSFGMNVARQSGVAEDIVVRFGKAFHVDVCRVSDARTHAQGRVSVPDCC